MLDISMEEEGLRGQLVFDPERERRLRLNPAMGPSETAEMLLHELIHGVLGHAGAGFLPRWKRRHAEDMAEWFTYVAAQGLVVVLGENPDLREWLFWALAQEP